MGTHPKAPAVVASTGERLSDFIGAKSDQLGEVITSQFGQNLPFLLKILSVNQALSIQGKKKSNCWSTEQTLFESDFSDLVDNYSSKFIDFFELHWNLYHSSDRKNMLALLINTYRILSTNICRILIFRTFSTM